jgi:hypothetical protein
VGRSGAVVGVDQGGVAGTSSRGNQFDVQRNGFSVKSKSGKTINLFGQ